MIENELRRRLKQGAELLEALVGDDLANQASLDPIGLDQQQRPLTHGAQRTCRLSPGAAAGRATYRAADGAAPRRADR